MRECPGDLARAGRGWWSTWRTQRRLLDKRLRRNLSLRPTVPEECADACAIAREEGATALDVARVSALHSVPFLTIKDIANNEFHAVTDSTGGFTNVPKAEAGRRAAALMLRLIERLAASSL